MALDENERIVYRQRYPEEVAEMTRFAERFLQQDLEKGRREGRQEGRQEGEVAILLRQLRLKFGPVAATVRSRIEAADADTLLEWSARILTAERIEDIFG